MPAGRRYRCLRGKPVRQSPRSIWAIRPSVQPRVIAFLVKGAFHFRETERREFAGPAFRLPACREVFDKTKPNLNHFNLSRSARARPVEMIAAPAALAVSRRRLGDARADQAFGGRQAPRLLNQFGQLYRWFPSILKAITIVRPETLVQWHRAVFRRPFAE